MNKRISRLILTLLFSGFVFFAACSKPEVHDALDKPISLQDMKGKWILLNYWADWCAPCSQEIPALNQINQKYKNKVAVLAINFDELPKSQLQQSIRENKINYPVVTKSFGARFFGISDIKSLPVTYVINSDRKIVKELYGAQTVESFKDAIGLV